MGASIPWVRSRGGAALAEISAGIREEAAGPGVYLRGISQPADGPHGQSRGDGVWTPRHVRMGQNALTEGMYR